MGDGKHTVVRRHRGPDGEVLGVTTVVAGSPEEALKLSGISRMTLDGHLCKDVLRTEAGVDAKTFCGLEISVAIGPEGSEERLEFFRRAELPMKCWKCGDRSE